MDFGNQIKQIRKEKNLTQEQFAQKLNVTRQAVSNWENNKNLPDIGMLIEISEVYDVSLDILIKGESDNDMNNMTEKIINDGSETKRAKYNMISTILGIGLILFGFMFWVIKGLSVEYIDAQGILHENFWMLPVGLFFMFCGFVVILSIGVRAIVFHFRNRKK